MLSDSGLPKSFWAEAAQTACFLVNRSPSSAIDFKTPEDVWTGKSPDYSYLKPFGCPVFIHVRDGKLDPRSKKGILLGYGQGVKGYRIWCPSTSKVEISRNVIFDEASFLR